MKFITRVEAGLRPPDSTPSSINSEGTSGHWAGGSVWSGVIGDHSRCASIWRAFQAYHMDHHNWSDIAYNAGACPHGYVLEGRGPGKRSAANGTNLANGKSAVVCYLGGEGDPFTLEGMQAMLDAAVYLQGDLIWDHGDWYSTACAGPEIRQWINDGCPMSEIPQPPGDEYMNQPGTELDGDGRVWTFVRGTDGMLYAKVLKPNVINVAGIPEVVFDWFEIVGSSGHFGISSGPTVKRVGAKLLVTARGNDGAEWGIMIGPNPSSVDAPIGNVSGWFNLGGQS